MKNDGMGGIMGVGRERRIGGNEGPLVGWGTWEKGQVEVIWWCFGSRITGRKEGTWKDKRDKVISGLRWLLEEFDFVHGQPRKPESTPIDLGSDWPAGIALCRPVVPKPQPDKSTHERSNTCAFELGKILSVVIEHHNIGSEKKIGDIFVIHISGLDDLKNATVELELVGKVNVVG